MLVAEQMQQAVHERRAPCLAHYLRTEHRVAELPPGEPRALGDVVLCPEVVGDDWRWPLVHGLLHLLGYEHGEAMEEREAAHT